MKKEDLRNIQRQLLDYMVYLKRKTLTENNPEELVDLEFEIMSVKNNIHKIELILKG